MSLDSSDAAQPADDASSTPPTDNETTAMSLSQPDRVADAPIDMWGRMSERAELTVEAMGDAERETRIGELEAALDSTETPRLLEPALAIDLSYLSTALITGEPARPERAFGDNAWLAHLEMRLFARDYGRRPLTTDFILRLHQIFLNCVSPGTITHLKGDEGRPPYGGRITDDGRWMPATYVGREVAAIEANPLLSFRRVEASDQQIAASLSELSPLLAHPDLSIGFIAYPHISAAERRALVDEICERHNEETLNGRLSPHTIAATTERSLVSLHPLPFEGNGRVARTVMNWSLENAGEAPSVLRWVDSDLLLPDEDWIEAVESGSRRYAKYRDAVMAGESDLLKILGLVRSHSVFKSVGLTPPPSVGTKWRETNRYDEFLLVLRLLGGREEVNQTWHDSV